MLKVYKTSTVFVSGIGKEEFIHTFTGSEWLEYSLDSRPIESYYDELSLSFKTNRQTGLLFHVGQTTDYMSLALKEGKLTFTINLKKTETRIDFEPRQGLRTYADEKWHAVRIERDISTVSSLSNMHETFAFVGLGRR